MGLYTHVKIAEELLPKKYQKSFGWQTKDVVESDMQTLEITKDKDLIYHWNEYYYDEDQVEKNIKDGISSIVAYFGCMKVSKEHHDKLDFHGDMEFHDIRGMTWIEGHARFTEGKLVKIKITESEI
jgi:hypothetical protein